MTSAQQSNPRPRATVAREDQSFPWFIGAALVTALAGGFLLALLLPLAAALTWDWGTRWRALAQAHGHLQTVGWLGLFIAGMAFRLTPRFAGRPLRFAAVTTPTLVLLVIALAGRAIAQPLLDATGMRALLVGSAVAEVAASLLLAGALIATLAPVLRTVAAAPLFILGVLGILTQAVLGVLWLPHLTAEAPIVPVDRDAALVTVQLFGFVLPFVLGVSLRALPTFFAHRAPTPRQTLMLAVALELGTIAFAAAPFQTGLAGVRLQVAGALLLAGGAATAVFWTGVWRPPERLRASARHNALLIRTAYAWLATVSLALVLMAFRAMYEGVLMPPGDIDAVRHMLALGVFTTLLMGMAPLMLPWLAMRRQRAERVKWETWTLWTLLTAATVLRVTGALLERQGVGAERYWPMALGGALAIIAIGFFALTVLRAARQRPPEIILHERGAS